MENSDFRTVDPVKPLAPYVGGKRNLAERLVSRIEQIPHSLYAEPFVGMGGVFLRRRMAARAEVINDLSGDVIGFFRILQRHYVPFLEFLRFQITSRTEFERLIRTPPDTLTDLERAARFLYLQRTAFGGKVVGRGFGVSPGHPARFDITKLAPMLERAHERLAGVVIECLPYGEFIGRYDRPEALFYLDPPYHGSEGMYGKGAFGFEDFARLADQLGRLKGRFLLSINDTSEVRECFKAFALEEVTTTYGLPAAAAVKARELIISNVG